jgi:DNA-binding NarL/FixJ family response regulator
MESSLVSILAGGFGPRPVLLAESDVKLLNIDPQTLKSAIPDLSVELCTSREEAISKLASRPTIAVVVLTRLLTPFLHELALQHGAQACLMKYRSSPQELSEAIQKAIASIAARS